MTDFLLKSGSGVTEWALNHAYSAGDRVVVARANTTGTWTLYARFFVWECTTPGTTSGAYPTWPNATANVSTVTDGAVFTARNPGWSDGSTMNWTFANIYLDYVWGALSAYKFNTATDRLLVSNNHAEASGATSVLVDPLSGQYDSPPLLCVDDSATPPTTLATGASCSWGNATLDHWFYAYGVTFKTTSGGLTLDSASGPTFDNCALWVSDADSASRIYVNGSNRVTMYNTTVRFSHANQAFEFTNTNQINSSVTWTGGGLHASSSAITRLFTEMRGYVELTGLDLSVASSAVNFLSPGTNSTNCSSFTVTDCKLPGSWSGSVSVIGITPPVRRVALMRCDSGATNYRFTETKIRGTVSEETTLVRSGGATDGTTALSWKMVADEYADFPGLPLVSSPIALWSDATGAQKTATVEILHDSATALKDDEVFLRVEYLNSASVPTVAIADDKRGLMSAAANQATSSAAWTTTGMSNPNKQKLEVTFTPQMKGFVRAYVYLTKASKTIYVDPTITLS